MVHGIKVSSSDVLATLLPALESDVGDWPWVDNAFKPMKSLYHVKYIREDWFFWVEGRGRAAQTFDENFSRRK